MDVARIVDFALVVVVVEAVVLFLYARRGSIRLGAVPVLANLAAGGCLMLAVRATLVGDGGTWILVWLFGSMVAHATDLWCRLRA